jgi:MinD-like ATPase involved in chromosome partitioning or flagellar assembly
MTGERYVLLGLAPSRARWFVAVAQWANSATIGAEFMKCVSADEVRARLASGRRYSALMVDAAAPAWDRDVVDAARAASTPVIVVTDGRAPAFAPADLGVSAVLAAGFGPDDLVDVLERWAQPVGRGDVVPAALDYDEPALWLGQLFTVCGPGGTGASTVAIALAQGLAADARYARRVVLADLARHADQAMLHDAADLGPGLQELVEAHRLSRLGPEEVRRLTFDVPRRGYRLLLGLRRPEGWAVLRPRAVDAAIEGLRSSFQMMVADVTGDVEGESEGGSIDVEERNHLARSAVRSSSVVVAVGAPGLKGVHSLVRLVRALISVGVTPDRIVPVVNRSPRSPAARAAVSRAFSSLMERWEPGIALSVAGPVPLAERKVEDSLRDGTPLPSAVVNPVVRAVLAVADRQADQPPAQAGLQAIVPGSLGSWSEAAESGSGSGGS